MIPSQNIRQTFAAVLLSCCSVLLAWNFYVFHGDGNFRTIPSPSNSWRCVSGSEKARLALVIFSSSHKQASENINNNELLQSLETYLVGTQFKPDETSREKCNFVRITFFQAIFTDNELSLIKGNAIPIRIDSSSNANPCRVLIKIPGLKTFHQVLLIDRDVRIKGVVNVGDSFLAKQLVAVLHQVYPNVKRSTTPFHVKKSYHFSSKIIGGSTQAVVEMCRKIDSAASSKAFHRLYNAYLHQTKPPDIAIIYPYGLDGVVNVTAKGTISRRLEGKLCMPAIFDEFERDFGKQLEADDDYVEAVTFDQTAQRISDALTKNYFAKMRNLIDNSDSESNTTNFLRFITASCPVNVLCGGFGDRLRGLATAFYMAIGTDRVFHVEHPKPVNLDSYFLINEHFYKVDPNHYAALRNASTENASKRIGHMNLMGQEFVDFINGPNFTAFLNEFASLDLISNRYSGLAALFHNRKFAANIEKMAEFQLGRKEFVGYEYPVMISAAFRTVFSRLTDRFQKLVDSTIEKAVGRKLWENSVKIGVQVRRGYLVSHQSDTWDRVVPEQIACFSQEVKRLINGKIRQWSSHFNGRAADIVLFLTTDRDDSIEMFRNHLNKLPMMANVTIFYTGKELNLTLTHVDHTKVDANSGDAWQTMAKTYVDWFLLTKMDFLIISRSGLSETASMMSLKPTRRFIHWDNNKIICPFQTYNAYLPNVAGSSFVSL